MTPDQFIAHWLRLFSPKLVTGLDAEIIKRKLVNRDELRKSLYARNHIDADRGIYFLMLYFREHGRYQDMSRRYDGNAGGEEMVEELFKWAQQRGIDKFMTSKNGKDYAGLYEGVPLSRILAAIAWGTIRKLNNQNRTKRRGWYTRPSRRIIRQGYAELIAGYSKAVLSQTKNDIIEGI